MYFILYVFLVLSLPGFSIRVMVSQDGLESVLSSALFWKRLCRICVNSSLNTWWNSPVKTSEPGGLLSNFLKFLKLRFQCP